MLEGAQKDDVSNIHRRWSFTRLSPSSFRVSFAGSLICGIVIIILAHAYYIQSTLSTAAFHVGLGGGILALLHFIDHTLLRGSPVNKLSKVAHVSLFGNLLWLLTAVLGIASNIVFSKEALGLDYVVAGMFLAAGLRVGIFTSVFGAGLARAAAVSFVMPAIFLFSFVPVLAHPVLLSSYAGAGFGIALYLLGVIWVIFADRAGRPIVKSTFGLLQAFLSAWTEKDSIKMEEYIESRALEQEVGTSVIRFSAIHDGSLAAAIVLPDLHPGPFGTVGGSNLPYILYQNFSRKALVMHSLSDHSQNIPSKREVERYLRGISKLETAQRGETCTHPTQVRIGKSTATGIAFGKTAVVMLSLAPYGMEDIPPSVRVELESHGSGLGFSSVLVIDCHNAMGRQLEDADKDALLLSAKQCLDELISQLQEKFMIGFAARTDEEVAIAPGELGQSGIAVMAIRVGNRTYSFGWADSNNMENSLRDQITAKVAGEIAMLEVCTSDTHSTSGTRTREGYLALGSGGRTSNIVDYFAATARSAAERAAEFCSFEYGRVLSPVKVMGKKQFEDYSGALDSSMNLTKIFVGVTIAVYIAMLFFS